eukprot:CAMPEP_0174318378 /NCGR_PEP_ID=MMETSP0810-20121108/8170_1 /TAXON_ID=73025 ORGANISM="Eutreptiella gymnastica-like, Strain CCMP1594" /NCGR_SAMPLE_ID=MMETSP0810 /ASSEMBLY_ACC=CAM_ASM_000659 /LENGTH=73 /DNA_ID=CAMNT_0015428591 /DNA_START=272 /DNA_END=490 /DNA_ORIENTATION=+
MPTVQRFNGLCRCCNTVKCVGDVVSHGDVPLHLAVHQHRDGVASLPSAKSSASAAAAGDELEWPCGDLVARGS